MAEGGQAIAKRMGPISRGDIPPARCGPLVTLLCCAALGSGCSSAWYESDADREVYALLGEYEERVLGDREAWVKYPEDLPEQPPEPEPQEEVSTLETMEERDQPRQMVIDLPTALEVAFTSSRDYQDRKETLYLQGLGFTLTRYNFGPILDATIAYLWSDAEDSIGIDSLSTTVGARQTLPTGGDLSVSSTLTGSRATDPPFFDLEEGRFYDASVQATLRQPLLRGTGYEVSHEALTQGEHNLIYEVRNFELFRQDFSIRVAKSFYDLVSEKTRLKNDEQNYLDAVFDRKKAEALQQVDRNQYEDVFLARRREIDAEDALLVSRTDYDLALDDFKILLGLPTSTETQIADDEPEFQAIRTDPRSAVTVAHHNRLDLLTDRDRIQDFVRQVRLAKNALLPDLDLVLAYGLDGSGDDKGAAAPDQWSTSIGITFGLPIDRRSERNSYRSSLIALERARRNLSRRLDEVERDILSQLRELTQLEKRIELQQGQIEENRRAVAVTQIRYESGDAETRDLLEARQGLTDAQNALIQLKVDHFIARLRLLQNLGVLFVDEKGQWRK